MYKRKLRKNEADNLQYEDKHEDEVQKINLTRS